MRLFDTNIFLEVLLSQEKSEECKRLLSEQVDQSCISDFSLHSIGVILFRCNKEDLFVQFVADVVNKFSVLSLPQNSYKGLSDIKKFEHLDFDDAYQYKIAEQYRCELVTMDKDFLSVKEKIEVRFV